MAKLILGIAGEMGSGKGTIANHVTLQYNGNTRRFSAILRDLLDRINVEKTRENISMISTVLRKDFGEDLLAKAMCRDTEKDEHDIVVVDGVRRMADITFLRELPHFKLIYVEADIQSRYERVVVRGENANDSEKTFQDFKDDHELETELQIRDLKNYADYVVDNDQTYQELYAQIDKIIKENIK